MTTLFRLIFAPLVLLASSCAHRPAPMAAPHVREEARFDCVAEVVEVKHEAWQFRPTTYS